MKKKVFFSWVGESELACVVKDNRINDSGVFRAWRAKSFDQICLFGNIAVDTETKGWKPYTKANFDSYQTLLQQNGCRNITIKLFESPPTDLLTLYDGTRSILEKQAPGNDVFYHASGGTNVWLVNLVFWSAKYPGVFLETKFPEHLRDSKNVEELRVPFELAVEIISVKDTDRFFRTGFTETAEFRSLLGQSATFLEAKKNAQKIAYHDLHVVIEGEAGTGKELFAEAIHFASQRKGKPFQKVNCGAFSENLLESELFGHEKGAFTGANQTKMGQFQKANGGTLFLDEVGELSLKAQVDILRAIPVNQKEGEVTKVGGTKPEKVDVRIIAATNRNLIQMVQRGEFREDLFWRLNEFSLKIPSIKERHGDVGLLLDYYFERWKKEFKQTDKRLSVKARKLLLNHTWPGNVRELLNTVKRLVALTDGNTISDRDVQEAIVSFPDKTDILCKPLGEMNEVLDEVERVYIERALKASNQKIEAAYQLLGFANRKTFENHMKRLGIVRFSSKDKIEI